MRERESQTRPDGADDRDNYAWYADGCPCGLPAGDCCVHPRARVSQRPPAGDWRTWLVMAGRGFGKTLTGAEWVRHQVEHGGARRVALVAPTAADARDVMIEGESGILAVCPPWNMPHYEPSKRRLTWPNGAMAIAYSAEEPQRLRGPQFDFAWADEVGAWARSRTWDMLIMGLRLGKSPRKCVTTTPALTDLMKTLLNDQATAIVRGSTYENEAHLAPDFIREIRAKYEGTRLGRQEIHAEMLESAEGAWFTDFDRAVHVTDAAEVIREMPARVAIDAGVSRCTAAIYYQVVEGKVRVIGDYFSEDMTSETNARAIMNRADELGIIVVDRARIDPAATARTGIGPVAYAEYERVLWPGRLDRWPLHPVVDGLRQVELLLDRRDLIIHPRCGRTIEAFQQYRRGQRGDEWTDTPADPQHPHEDMMDALRGGIRDAFPEGWKVKSPMRRVPSRRVF